MGKVKAVLVAVSDYRRRDCTSLPLCKNDLYAMRKSLIQGINVKPENILMCGESGIVLSNTFKETINKSIIGITEDDTYIFYFSGHGGNGCLCLSIDNVFLQGLLNKIDSIPAKNKIAIIDSCHSGNFELDKTPTISIEKTIEQFVGHGFAVMASCGADQFSWFHAERKISLYTSFVCDAFLVRSLIREGRKSLESINEAVFRFVEIANKKALDKENNSRNIQNPVFRSSIGGTIFFDVEEYNPYKVQKVYVDTEDYIIYSVEPLHNSKSKRFAVKVILRYQSTEEQVGEIAKEIKNTISDCEVYQNETAERIYKNNPPNVVFYYFGYDEDDIVNSNFAYNATWVDDAQDKNEWYYMGENAKIKNNVYIQTNNAYKLIKTMQQSNMSDNEFIELTKKYTVEIIYAAEQYIKIFREYINNVICEEELVSRVEPIGKQISMLFFKHNDLPLAPRRLHDWSQKHDQIISTIHNFSLFYNQEYLDTWDYDRRKWLMKNAIMQYERELEMLKQADGLIN